MTTPSTIYQWLEERISFIENILSSTSQITNYNAKQISDFTLVVENFKYCRRLYIKLLQDKTNGDVKSKFKNIANKLIADMVYELDKQEYKCVSINGISFPTNEKENLPQEHIDNFVKYREALENIFYEVQKLCDDNKRV